MLKRISFLGSIFALIIFLRCGIFEPEPTKGSLRIILVRENTGKNLGKAEGTLNTVQCIVKKGTDTIYNRNLTEQGASFRGEITDLEPGTDYSVLLYGKNSMSAIIARGYQAGISVSAGNETTVNMLWSAFAPVLDSPANGSTTTDNTPGFEWNRVNDAVAYELVVGKSSGFGSLAIHNTYLTSTSYTATSSLADGKYYWRVRCRDNQGNWGNWSSTWNFTIDTQGPGAPTLSSLENGSTINDNTPSFDWSDVDDAVNYEIIVDNSSEFSSPEIHKTDLTSSNYTATSPLVDGKYYWKVRCRDNQGNWGSWSSTWNFTIDTQGPGVPTLLSPTGVIYDNTPTFQWSDVGGAVAYELKVYDNSGTIEMSIIVTDTTYTPSNPLPIGIHYWRVRCKNSSDKWGDWSSIAWFTIGTQGPSPPILDSPENGSTISDNTPSFNWSDVSNAVKYEIIVDNSSGFGSPEIHKTDLTSSNYTTTTSLVDGKYYWKVRGRDNQERWGSWSSTWYFSIKTGYITVTSPNGGEIWELGSTHNITWNSNIDGHVEIKLYTNEGLYETIASSMANYGSHSWTIPTGYEEYDYYKIRILSKANTSIDDYSDGYFSLQKPPLLFVTPDSLYFGPNTTSQKIYITNIGGGTLIWEVSTEQGQITLDPTSGSTTTETDQVTVTVDLSELTSDNYNATVTVSSNGGTEDVRISITVDGGAYTNMIYIPAGEFIMGSNEGDSNEQPVHEVYLDAYYIGKYEVTNEQYAAYLNERLASGDIQASATTVTKEENELIDLDAETCQISYIEGQFLVDSGKGNYPVIEVTWYGAKDFCEWAGGRLPTEAEWEKASRGTDDRKYPWGNTEPTSSHCNFNNNVGHTTPVGQYSPKGNSPYGCCDMAGNVWEWCSDWYDAEYYYDTPYNNPQGPSSGSYRINRGGGWTNDSGYVLRCTYRNRNEPGVSSNVVGFRCVKDL